MPPHPAADFDPPVHTPIGISGDDTQYSLSGSKVIVMLVSFLLYEPGPAKLSRFPWFVLRHELSLGAATLDPVVRILTWSLNLCFEGVHPQLGPLGDQLSTARAKVAGRAIKGSPYSLCEVRGDWKWHVDLLRIKRHYGSNQLCMFCTAERNPGPHQWLGVSCVYSKVLVVLLGSMFTLYNSAEMKKLTVPSGPECQLQVYIL